MTWEALQSWAADTEVLEPLGFIRAYLRTEASANLHQLATAAVNLLADSGCRCLIICSLYAVECGAQASPTLRLHRLPRWLCCTLHSRQVHERSGQVRMFDTRYTRGNLSAHETLGRADVLPGKACSVADPKGRYTACPCLWLSQLAAVAACDCL